MAEVASAFVSLMPSAKGFGKGIEKAIGGDLDRGGKVGGKRFSGGMAAGVAGMASKVFAPLAAAAGAVALGGWVKGAVAEAGNLEQSMGAVEAVFKGSSGQIKTWASTAATDVGLTTNKFNEFATVLGSQLKNGGAALDEIAPKTQQLIGIGADLASMFGGTTADAVGALSSALRGERDPIERYGVSLTQASIDAKAAELGFSKVGGALSQQASQAATLALIMDQTADAQGNFGRETQTLAGQQQILAAQATNLSGTFGQLLVPALTGVLGAVTSNVMPGLQNMATGLVGLRDLIVSGDFSGALTEAFGWEEDGSMVAGILGMRDAIIAGFADGGLIGAAQAAFTGVVDWLSTGGITSILDALLAGREALLNGAMQLFPAIIEALVLFVPQLITAVSTLIPTLAGFLISSVPLLLTAAVTLFTSLIQGVATVVPQLVTTISTLLPQLVTTIMTMVPLLLTTAITLFTTLLDAVVQVLPELVTTLLGLLPVILPTILGMVPQLLTAGVELFLALVNAVLDVLPQLLDMLLGTVLPQVLSTVLGMLPQLLQTGIQVFMALLQAVMQILPQLLTLIIGTVIPRVLTTVLGMLPQLLGTAVQVFLAILTGLIQVLPQIIGFIIGTLIPTVVREVGGLAGKLLTKGVEALAGLLDGIGQKWPDIMAWFGELPGKVAGALSDAGRWLYDAGKSIIQGLIDGIGSMVSKVTDAVGNVLSAARDLLPFSPAKKGPFSGKGWTLYSGRSITSALADGISDNRGQVAAATRSVVDAASMAGITGPSLRANLSAVGAAGGIAGVANRPGPVDLSPATIAQIVDGFIAGSKAVGESTERVRVRYQRQGVRA